MQKKVVKKAFQSPRQRAWLEMRKVGEFTIHAVADAAQMKYEACRHYVSLLVKAGYVMKAGSIPVHHKNCVVKQKFFKLIEDCGFTAPALTKKGERASGMTVNKAMWNVLRISKSAVSAEELAALASTDTLQVEVRTAEEYLRQLWLADYLRIAKKHSTHGGKRKYQLINGRDTGPNAPQIMRAKQVFDPNTSETIPVERPDVLEEISEGLMLAHLEQCYEAS